MNQRPCQRHALLLPTRQRSRPFTGAVFQSDGGQRLTGFIPPVSFEPQPDVINHRLPGQQSRILKHHAGIVLNSGQRRCPCQNVAAVGGFQSGQKAQQRTLAAAAAPDNGHKLPGGNMQIQRVKNGVFAVAFGHAV